jgi:integrase/recombinase XerC
MTFSHARRGKRLTPHGVQKILRVLSGRIGTLVRPHGLRHTAITTAIDAAAANGLSIDLVRQFSRHKSIGTLLIYRDVHENKQGQLAEYVAATVNCEPAPIKEGER